MGKGIKPLKCKGLLNKKVYEKETCLRRQNNKRTEMKKTGNDD